jgi:hypothetical protein
MADYVYTDFSNLISAPTAIQGRAVTEERAILMRTQIMF